MSTFVAISRFEAYSRKFEGDSHEVVRYFLE